MSALREPEGILKVVRELKAARWRKHELGSRAHARNEGEQNAFNMVISLLEGNSVEGMEL